jgi:hypothetical protein
MFVVAVMYEPRQLRTKSCMVYVLYQLRIMSSMNCHLRNYVMYELSFKKYVVYDLLSFMFYVYVRLEFMCALCYVRVYDCFILS